MNEGGGSSGIDDRVALVTEVLRSFADATNDYPRLVRTIAARTATLVGHACSLRLVSEDGARLEPGVLFDPTDRDGDTARAFSQQSIELAGHETLTQSLGAGKTFLVREITAEHMKAFAAAFSAEARDGLLEYRITSAIVAPVSARGDLVAALFLVRREGERALDQHDCDLVEALAAHAGLALSNARTLHQLTREIEERRRAETTLAVTERARAYQRSIVQSLSQPVLVLDDEGSVQTANRAFSIMFGIDAAQIVGHPWHALAGRALDVPRMRTLLHVARGATSSDVEAPIAVPGLGGRILKIALRRLRSDEPTSWGSGAVLLVFEDVTERTEIALELERRAILFESMSEAVYAGDFDFRITEANPAAEKLFGWTAAEVRQRTVHEVIELTGVDRVGGRARILQGETVRGRGRVAQKNGTIIDVEFSSTPVKAAGVITGFVCVMQNITERLRLEQASEDQLSAMKNAVAELESFSYSVSHDLRAPIRAIEGFSQLLQDEHGTQLDAEGMRLLAVVRKNSRRMGHLIDDLLDFSRLGRRPLATSDTDMDALAREAADTARTAAETAEPGRTFELTIDPLPHVSGDRSLLAQVWKNLLENAVKYSRGRAPAIIRVTSENTDEEVVFHVRDNGVGFDMKYVQKLFGVFERLHTGAEFEGTGVGLALVERIVRRHGGRVWAESVEGEGATFHFALRHASPVRDEGREE